MNRDQRGYLLKKLHALILLFLLPVLFISLYPMQSSAGQRNISPIIMFLLNNSLCKSGPQTVLINGRLWQRCDNGQRYNWEDAENFCNNLNINGSTDWRLPTKEELKSLVLCSNGVETPLKEFPQHPYYCGGESIDQTYTSPTIPSSFVSQSKFYWSSSLYYGDYRWGVYFLSGFTDWEKIANGSFVRCISVDDI